MKGSLLTILSVMFGLTLTARAVSVYSDVQNTPTAQVPDLLPSGDAGPAGLPEGYDSNTQCLRGPVYDVLMEDLKTVDARRLEIAEREAALSAIEDKLEKKLETVEAANAALQTRIDDLKSIANQDIMHLVKMYQTMKPKEAAEIFNSMDPGFAAGFLREMDSGNAGLIMANIDAEKSYAISVIIAGRNAKYRDQVAAVPAPLPNLMDAN